MGKFKVSESPKGLLGLKTHHRNKEETSNLINGPIRTKGQRHREEISALE